MPLTTLNYDLLAVDLDGTLLGPDGSVSEANVAAVRAAADAGLRVVVCTGRGLVECRRILDRVWGDHLPQAGPVIVAGGAITADPATGRTLHRFQMPEGMVRRAVARVHGAGLAAMVLKDPAAAGFDYLVVEGAGGHPLDPVTAWWFEMLHVSFKTVVSLEQDEHPEQTVRVGACADAEHATRLAMHFREEFGAEATLHSFPAVVAKDLGTRRVHILEVFDAAANKWTAVERLAAEMGVPTDRVAAIGDEINDAPMIAGAGLGIAMGNAIEQVRGLAQRVTKPNTESGVAHAIDRILSGAW